ncbi:MAG: cytochrome c oxidase assembly protein [Actinomycetota bacterium]|nr:cytochrome c oxidase assembly protein [Actinomycetota bacterium]
MADSRPWALAGGAAVTLASLSPAAHARADGSLTAHMVQHVVLLVVAAPLLAAARRPATDARPAGVWALVAAFGLHAGLMVAWHLPPAFDAAERTAAVHALEHLSLLATAVVFWAAVGVGARLPQRLSLLAVFAASMVGVALGAAMTLASAPWYAAHPNLADQQVAGVVMWAFAGLVYLGLGVLLFVRSLGDAEPAPRLAPPLGPTATVSSS